MNGDKQIRYKIACQVAWRIEIYVQGEEEFGQAIWTFEADSVIFVRRVRHYLRDFLERCPEVEPAALRAAAETIKEALWEGFEP